MRSLATLLALTLLFAGCINKTDDPPADDVPPAESAAVEPASTETAPPAAASNASAPSSSSAPAPSSNGSATAPPAPPAEPAPRIDVLAWEGTITALGMNADTPAGPICCPQAQAAGENVEGTIEVVAGIKGIVVEIMWTDTTFDLDLVLDAPDVVENVPPSDPTAMTPEPSTRTGHWWSASAGTPSAPDGHATIVITDAEALALVGTWTWSVQPKGPANEVAFSVATSVFYDAVPAEGYSALATPSDNP